MTDEAPTPRTDKEAQNAEYRYLNAKWDYQWVHASFARELERDLIRLRSENAELQAGLDESVSVNQDLSGDIVGLTVELDRYRAVLVELVAAWDAADQWDDKRMNDAVVAARALTTKGST